MNYLICNHCQFKNSVYSERIIFCQKCQKKMDNNFLDWKKSKFNSSFNDYIKETTTLDGTPLEFKEKNQIERKYIFKNSINQLIPKSSSESKIFFISTFIQLILFYFLTLENSNKSDLSNDSYKSYLKEVKWNNYSITQNIDISLPFELKESKSVLPEYLHNYLSNEKTLKSESSKSFSVTIEEFDAYEGFSIDNRTLLSINDEYMQNANAHLSVASPIEYFKINNFNSYSQYGSYILDDKKYLFENYTLTSGDKTIKIIISYLDGDKTLRKYADIVSQSLIDNKTLI